MNDDISKPPVLFIHGLWVHASAWDPWIQRFESAGYTASAPGWPGESDTVAATRNGPELMDGVGITAIYDHYRSVIESMPAKPVVIGHSFGGLIAQQLLAADCAVAAVAIDPAPIKGVTAIPLSQLRSGFPVLGNPANRKRTVALTSNQFHYGFGNAISRKESDDLFEQWAIPGPGRPLFEDAAANFSRHSAAAVDTHHAVRGPLLLLSGDSDHTVPSKVTKQAFRLYSDNPSITEYQELPGRGHSLTLDHGWELVADTALAWLAAPSSWSSPATAKEA